MHCTTLSLYVCQRGQERARAWPQRRTQEVLLRAERGFFFVYCFGQSLQKWLCWVMTLGSSETFASCLKRGENAFLPLYLSSPATTAFNFVASWPRKNNEKVAKTQSHCQRPSARFEPADRTLKVPLWFTLILSAVKPAADIQHDRCHHADILLFLSAVFNIT